MKKLIYLLLLLLGASGAGAQQVQGFEYAFDTDPGAGNGTYVALPPAASVDTQFHVPLSSLSTGVHTLFVRMKDTAGKWGHAQASQFFAINGTGNYLNPALTAIEYHLDSITGTPFVYNLPANTLSVDDTLHFSFPGITPGFHNIYIRTRSANNLNSAYMVKSVVFFNGTASPDSAKVTGIEYAVDATGTWTAVPVTPAAVVDTVLHLSLAGQSPGLHRLYTRTRDNLGGASHYSARSFMVSAGAGSDSITAAEVFFDTDPGFGNGVSVALSPLPQVDTTVSITVPGNLSNGWHKMYVRTKDSRGQWSQYQAKDSVRICTQLPVVAGFDKVRYGNTISFIDTSKHAQNYLWRFGDGSTDTVAFPLKNYGIGSYVIWQKVTNSCNVDSTQGAVVIEGVENYMPKKAGSGGDFLMTVYGAGLDSNVSVQLIQGTTVISPIKRSSVNPKKLNAFFDLHQATSGTYDVKITLPNNQVFHYPSGFTIDTLLPVNLSANLVGPSAFRPNRWEKFKMVLSNSGNVMANGTLLFLVVDNGVEVKPRFHLLKSRYLDTFQRYSNTIIRPIDSFQRYYDSLQYITLDTFDGKAYNGRAYVYSVPAVMPGSSVSLEVELMSTIPGTKKNYLFPGLYTMFGSGETDGNENFSKGVFNTGASALGELTDPLVENYVQGSYDMSMLSAKMALLQMMDKDYFLDNPDVAQQMLAELAVAQERERAARAIAIDEAGKLATTEGVKRAVARVLKLDKVAKITGRAQKYYKSSKAAKMLERLKDKLPGSVAEAAEEQFVEFVEGKIDDGYSAVGEQVWEMGKNFPSGNVAIEKQGASRSMANADNLGEKQTQIVTSFDPNEMYGPLGFGNDRYVRPKDVLDYSIAFENVDTALAAAQVVNIYDTLDKTIYDLQSLSFLEVKVGDKLFTTPTNRKEFTANYDLRPEVPYIVRLNARLDTAAGVVHWQFITLDTLINNMPDDPYAGFLPPNIVPPIGEGRVSFSVRLQPSIQDNTAVTNKAHIYFDDNASIVTNDWQNKTDGAAPNSSVTGYSQVSDSSFWLFVNNQDVLCGANYYVLMRSVNNRPYQALMLGQEDSVLIGGYPDTAYRFYTIGVDMLGNMEQKAPVPEATVTLQPTYISEISTADASSLNVYPNPSRGDIYLEIQHPYTGEIWVQLVDVLGKTIAATTWNKQSAQWQQHLRYDHLSPGVYYIKVKDNDEGSSLNFVRKIVIVQR